MNPILMSAMLRAAAAIIDAGARTVAKSGLAIILLVIVSGGLLLYALDIDRQRQMDKAEFKMELAAVRNEYRTELAACNKAREELAIQVATLRAEVSVMKNRKR